MNQDFKRQIEAYPLTEVPGHLIRRCQQRAVDLFLAEVGESGPTPRQFSVLLNIFQNPGMSQTALVQASGIDRSTLTEILRRLIERGLISRTRLKEDQRANALTVTDEGEATIAASFDAARRAQERILDPIPPTLRAQAIEILVLLAGYGHADDEIGKTARSRNKSDAPA